MMLAMKLENRRFTDFAIGSIGGIDRSAVAVSAVCSIRLVFCFKSKAFLLSS